MTTAHAIVLYTSDLHGHVSPFKTRDHKEVGGIAYLASAVQQVVESNPDKAVFWVDAGDSLSNSTISDLSRGKPLLEMMRQCGLDAMTIGNHEFDSTWGKEAIAEASSKAGFPLLGANIRQQDGTLLKGLQAVALVEHHGVHAAILGATTPDTPQTTLPSNVKDLKFLSLEETVSEFAPGIEKKHPEMKIMVVHAGPEQSRRAVERAGEGWIVVGGHTEERVDSPIPMGRNLYVKGGSYGESLGLLEVEVDTDSGRILRYQNRFIPVGPDYQKPNPKILESVKKAEADLEPVLDRVVGQAEQDLRRNHQGESLLDDLITDAMRQSSGAEVALRNSTATREDILAGPVRVRDLYAVIPWDEPIQIVTMRHADLVKALEHSVTSAPIDPHTLQVSGIFVRYNRSLPEGDRVVDAVLDSGEVIVEKGKILHPDAELTVAARPFLVQGGLGYDSFKRGRNLTTGEIIRKAVENHLKDPGSLKNLKTGRIQFV